MDFLNKTLIKYDNIVFIFSQGLENKKSVSLTKQAITFTYIGLDKTATNFVIHPSWCPLIIFAIAIRSKSQNLHFEKTTTKTNKQNKTDHS